MCLLVMSLAACQRAVLREIRAVRGQISKLDSIYRSREAILYRYEKARIDSATRKLDDVELLELIRRLTKKQ